MTEATQIPGFIEQALAAQDPHDQGNPFSWFESERPVTGLRARLRRWWETPEGRHRSPADGASQTR